MKTIVACHPIMYHAYKSSRPNDESLELCFEILGFDILIDKNLKPWLIEVNLSPSLAVTSKVDLKVKSNLMADLFTLIGIVPYDQRDYINIPENKT